MARRTTAVAILAAAITITTVGTASAGEVTGKGGATPVASYRAASICSFSGLNDTYSGDPEVPDEEGFTRVQNWGHLPSELRAAVRSGEVVIEHLVPPNVACNPSLAHQE